MKLETLKSLRAMAGLPAISEDDAKQLDCEFTFGDSTAQDEPDGRHSWYVETFCGDNGHYSVVLYSDGTADIQAATGPEIDVNSLLGQKIITAARKKVGSDPKFSFEQFKTANIAELAGIKLDENARYETSADFDHDVETLKSLIAKALAITSSYAWQKHLQDTEANFQVDLGDANDLRSSLDMARRSLNDLYDDIVDAS